MVRSGARGGKYIQVGDKKVYIWFIQFNLSKLEVTRKEIQDASQWADLPATQIADTLAYIYT